MGIILFPRYPIGRNRDGPAGVTCGRCCIIMTMVVVMIVVMGTVLMMLVLARALLLNRWGNVSNATWG